MDTREQNKEVIEKFFGYLQSPLPSGQDLSDMKNMFSDDAVWEMPFMPAPLEKAIPGRVLIGHFIDWFFAAVPDMRIFDRVVHPTLDPNFFVIEFKASATVTMTGKPYNQTYVLNLQIRDGKLSRLREHFDAMVVWEAFGGYDGLLEGGAKIQEAASAPV